MLTDWIHYISLTYLLYCFTNQILNVVNCEAVFQINSYQVLIQPANTG